MSLYMWPVLCTGSTIRGLNIHPDGLHIVYPLGCKVVVQNWKTKSQVFLSGHTNAISAIAVSPNGKYIASGQNNYMGFKVSIDTITVNSALKATVLLTENNGTSVSRHWKMSDEKADEVWVVTPATSGRKVAGCRYYWTPIILSNFSWSSSFRPPESCDGESD